MVSLKIIVAFHLWSCIVSGVTGNSATLPLGIRRRFVMGPDIELLIKVNVDEENAVGNIEIIAIEMQLEHAGGSQDAHQLHMVAFHAESYRSWMLISHGGQNTSDVTFCLQQPTTEFFIVARNMMPSNHSKVAFQIKARRKDISLKLEAKQHGLVSVTSPLTYTIEPPDGDDNLLISIEAQTNPQVCMVVAVYNNQHCPLKDRPDNVNTAEMYATGLSSVTMILTPGRFRPGEPVYISLLVLPEYGRCPSTSRKNLQLGQARNGTLVPGMKRNPVDGLWQKNVSVEAKRLPPVNSIL